MCGNLLYFELLFFFGDVLEMAELIEDFLKMLKIKEIFTANVLFQKGGKLMF